MKSALSYIKYFNSTSQSDYADSKSIEATLRRLRYRSETLALSWLDAAESRCPAAPLPRTEIEEDHSEEDQCEVEGFAAEVLFFEDQSCEEEADYDAAAADHGNYGNHRAGH